MTYEPNRKFTRPLSMRMNHDLSPQSPRVVDLNDPRHARIYVETPTMLSRVTTNASDAHRHSPTATGMTQNDLGGPRKWTQEDQNDEDAQNRKKAMKELLTSWMDRLQSISVITTFFAAMESQLMSLVTPDQLPTTKVKQAAAALLASALVVHVFAAIISFMAGVFLIRFRLQEATHDELKAELGGKSPTASMDGSKTPPIFSSNPHVEEFGPFRKSQPPTNLLKNSHTLCMILSLLGFLLALAGLMCFVWAWLPLSARVFTTVCIAFCCIGSGIAIFDAW